MKLKHTYEIPALSRKIDRLVAIADLTQDAAKQAGPLAHGQQQWLEIAVGIGLRPKLLFLDEPTAGMSPEETHKTGELVMELNRSDMTILVVEHDMAFVRQIARQVSVLHLGRLFAQGSIDQIIGNEAVQEIYLGKGHHAQ